ncbi:MAG: hypothetical protein HY767_00305 [Candidatus Omnitrophica bacterium]|nr:hypothetical protein [Candidatus Omnitrophota bacterium]
MEGQASIGDMIRFSWAKSREILFPFNFKRWFMILIIVSFAGAGIQGISANFNAPAKSSRPSSASGKSAAPKMPSRVSQQKMEKMSPASQVQTPPVSGVSGSSTEQIQAPMGQSKSPFSISQDAERIAKLRAGEGRSKPKVQPALAALIAGGAIFLALFFIVCFAWLSSRFNFVLLDALVTREATISEPFKKNKEAGNSYFVWTLAFMGIVLGAFLLAGLIIVLSVGITKWQPMIGIPLIVLGGLLILAVVVAMIFVGTVMRDFVLPVMYREKIPATDAMNKFLEADTFAFGKVFQYLLVVLGLWIIAAIVQSIVGILIAIGGMIAGGLVAVPGVILIKALPFLKLPIIILGGLLAIALVLAVIAMVGMIMLPVAIFFRVFALAYLTRLYPECDLLEFQGKGS